MSLNLDPSKKLRFADHVRACRIGDQVILLDLQRNKYHGVGGTQSVMMSQVVVDWPTADGHSALPPSTDHSAAVNALLTRLSSQSLLVRAFDAPPSPNHLDEPLDSWHPSDPLKPSGSMRRDLLRLGWSAAGAAYWLRWHSLAQIAGNVTHLRNRAHGRTPTEPDELQCQVASYMRTRPFIFSAYDRCLHDSLSLIRFLAARALFPQWVIGVRTRPFAAHSWVQSGNLVLTDLHENVRAFRPILVV